MDKLLPFIKVAIQLQHKARNKFITAIKQCFHLPECIVCGYSFAPDVEHGVNDVKDFKDSQDNNQKLRYLCSDCLANLPLLANTNKSHLCILCSQIINDKSTKIKNTALADKPNKPGKSNKCASCEKSSFYINQVRSVYSYQFPVDYWLQQYKFHRQYFYADMFSQLFYQRYIEDILANKANLNSRSFKHTLLTVDAVAAIPSHPLRKLSHGFDHTEVIAKKISRLLNLPYIKPLRRNNNAKPLSKLDALSRQRYIKDSYSYQPSSKANNYKCIALVDDIITSGSTAKEAAKCLHKGTACAIEIWSIARVL